MTVAIIDTGVANFASVQRALALLGCEHDVTRDPERIQSASHVILPGVGSFGAAMNALRASGAVFAVRAVIERDTPLLAICLGMQLLTESSDESPGVPGLGIVTGNCRGIPGTVRSPHLGWNLVVPDQEVRYVTVGDAAFANSFALRESPAGWSVSRTEHGIPFIASMERGRTLACQFHPELSGRWGMALIERWLENRTVSRSASPPRIGGLSRRVIPCLDVAEGRVVKGIRFQSLRDSGDPAARAAEYARQGADEIALLDIAATPSARNHQVGTVTRVRQAIDVPLTVGGGVRSVEDARHLLAAGADKVAVNSAAIGRPELIDEMATELGTQCVVLAVDAARRATGWEVLSTGGRISTGQDAVTWMEYGVQRGVGEILLTSWDRDGTRDGCDLDLIATATGALRVPVIASGGVGEPRHLIDALKAGADAVLCASVLHEGDETVGSLKAAASDAGFQVRS